MNGSVQAILERGDLYLFAFDLSGWEPSGLPGLWSTEEKQRAAAIPHQTVCKRFLAGRWLLRGLLQQAFALDKADLVTGPQGRPHCPQLEGIDFNISHTGDWWMAVFRQGGPVGLDIEDPRRQVSTDRVGRRMFTEAERDWVSRSGEEGFLRMWTRKEARVKASGGGVAATMAGVDTLTEEAAQDWQYHSFIRIPDVLGTVAFPGPGGAVRADLGFLDQERLQSVPFAGMEFGCPPPSSI